jgi:GNAT superfamily N-acetyltransferase
MSKITARIDIRPYRDADEIAVVELLDAALGLGGPAGARPVEFFRWKHIENPFGRSFMLVAENEGNIVGLRAFMRWGFAAGDRRLHAVRAVDTATHPDHQGQGIFSKLTLESLEALRGEADFVFNTPNEKSLPGYLKMGWTVVGQVPVSVRVQRPFRFATRAKGWRSAKEAGDVPPSTAPAACQVLEDDAIFRLLDDRETPAGISTPRDANYLRWRYGRAPLLDYRAVEERREGRLEGLCIFRVRPRGRLVEGTVAEIIVREGDVGTGRRLLLAARRSARLDHLTCSLPVSSSAHAAAKRAGFLRVPGGMTLVVNPLGHGLDPDPVGLASWALSLGDLEVF